MRVQAFFSRRWRWPVGAVVLLGFVAWVIHATWTPAQTKRAQVKTSGWPSLWAHAVSASSSDPAVNVAAASGVPLAPGEVEVCGGFRIKPREDGSVDDSDASTNARFLDARRRVLNAVQADGSELARVVALWLAPQFLGENSPTDEDRSATRDEIARLAAHTSDSAVYALAFQLCGAGLRGDAGACQLLNAARWAQLDPDNASPWFFAYGEATARADRSAQAEAMHRIAMAKKSELGAFRMSNRIASLAPDDDAAQMAAMLIAVDVVGTEAAFPYPNYWLLTGACKSDGLVDANLRQSCEAVATVLTDHSDNLLERVIGARMGVNLGRTTDRLDQIRGEQQAYGEVAGSLLITGRDEKPLSCAVVHRAVNFLRARTDGKELAAVSAWVAASGKTPDDFMKLGRAQRERMETLSKPASGAAPAIASSASAAAR